MKQLINEKLVDRKLSAMAVCLIGCSTLLSGCVTTSPNGSVTADPVNVGMGIGKTVFQNAVSQQCRQEMADSTLWKMSKIVYNKSKQERITYSVCGCVSQNAVQSVTPDQLVLAAVDSNAKKTLILSSVNKSLTSCYKQTMKDVRGF